MTDSREVVIRAAESIGTATAADDPSERKKHSQSTDTPTANFKIEITRLKDTRRVLKLFKRYYFDKNSRETTCFHRGIVDLNAYENINDKLSGNNY